MAIRMASCSRCQLRATETLPPAAPHPGPCRQWRRALAPDRRTSRGAGMTDLVAIAVIQWLDGLFDDVATGSDAEQREPRRLGSSATALEQTRSTSPPRRSPTRVRCEETTSGATRRLLYLPSARCNAGVYVTERGHAMSSADRTMVPCCCTHRRLRKKVGEVPVLIDRDDGSDVPMGPQWSVQSVVCSTRGGAGVRANVRDGGAGPGPRAGAVPKAARVLFAPPRPRRREGSGDDPFHRRPRRSSRPRALLHTRDCTPARAGR